MRGVFFFIIILIGAVVAAVVYYFGYESRNIGHTFRPNIANMEYTIEGRRVQFRDGVASHVIAGSSLVAKTILVEPTLYTDLNNNGSEDAVVILADQPGGSGTFYYFGAVTTREGTTFVSSLKSLGDRIQVQSLTRADDVIELKYLQRATNEPFSTDPSIETIRRFRWNGSALIEIR